MEDNNKKNRKKQKKGKSPALVSHTKAYYRFSKDYPGEVDEKGYRDNANIREKPLENRGRLIVYFSIIFCFILAFVATSVALKLSKREPDTTRPAISLEDEFNNEELGGQNNRAGVQGEGGTEENTEDLAGE